MLVTHTATATAGFTLMIVEWILNLALHGETVQ
jgi:hypothetical protein